MSARGPRRGETYVASGLSARRHPSAAVSRRGDAGYVADGHYDEGNDDDFARPRLSFSTLGSRRERGRREGILAASSSTSVPLPRRWCWPRCVPIVNQVLLRIRCSRLRRLPTARSADRRRRREFGRDTDTVFFNR